MTASDITKAQEFVRDEIVAVGYQALQLNKAGDYKVDEKEKSLMALIIIKRALAGLEDLIADTTYTTIDDDEFADIIELASIESRNGKV